LASSGGVERKKIGSRANDNANGEGRFEHELRKADALKLRPGQTIRYGDSMWSRNCDHNWREGKVLFVTAQGWVRGGGYLVLSSGAINRAQIFHRVDSSAKALVNAVVIVNFDATGL
jgi:hypothetical protein